MLPTIYTYKVVGVTFQGRQKVLRQLFRDAVKDGADFDAEIRPYEFEGSPALAVFLNDSEVGSIAADAVVDVSDIINKKDPFIDAEVRLNNFTPDEYANMLEDRDLYEDELAEIKDDPIYSAVVHLVVDDRPAVVLEPSEPAAPRELNKYEKKLLKITEKNQKKEAKRAAREEKRKKLFRK